jgi:predicted RNase H-like HicB family nuclease
MRTWTDKSLTISGKVITYPGEDGYWIAECPSLPGCISQGKTKEEAIANIKEAIQGYIA